MSRQGGEGSSRLGRFTRDGQRFEQARRARFNSRFENRFEESRLENVTDPPDLEGSTRLSDVPLSRFELRALFREQQRERLEQARRQFADDLDLRAGLVRSVQLDDRGEDIGFVPTDRGRETLAERFADDRPFVEPGDALVDANPREGTLTRTDPDRLDEIATRAERETAGQADFIEPADLDADVGPGGVEDITTRPDRRDDIRRRVQQSLSDNDPFATPGDFGVQVGPRGVESATLTDTGARRRAGRQFADQTALDTVGTDDVRETDDGFGLTGGAQRRLAARQFEDEFPAFGQGTLDPATDVRATDGAFGLAEEPAREVAAADIDQQLPDIDVGPGDIDLQPSDDGGFEAIFEREVRR